MHLHNRVWRNVLCAIALVTFALPLATPLATPTQAQTATPAALPAGCTPSMLSTTPGVAGTIGNCKVAVTPNAGPAIFNPLGTPHTVTFTCDVDILTEGLIGLGGTTAAAAVPPGCYNVTGSVQDITTGSAVSIETGTCGGTLAPTSDGSLACGPVSNPICPVTTSPIGTAGTVAGTTATSPCTAPGTPATGAVLANTAQVKFTGGANHAYTTTFTGYVPTTAAGSCPTNAGLTGPTTVTFTPTRPTGAAPVTVPMCRFEVTANKKYVEITNITLQTVPPNTPCGGALTFSEGFKAFFGPRCPVIATATGTVVLKTGVNCTNGTEPATGTSAATSATDFPPGSTYQCSGDTLSVTNIPVSLNLNFTVTGPGSFNTLNTLGTLCAGVVGTTSAVFSSGTVVNFCPTGAGSGTIQACLAGPLPNNQPPICSNTLSFQFTITQSRVVPMVKWAGEKVALTKCFGPGLAGSPVEFTLKGNNPGLNATLIPTDLASVSGGEPNGNSFPTADTIWTVTDANGCASVLGLADGEGQMTVDAAIFNVTGPGVAAGGPIINEHSFEVFYLKFDHVDLENIAFQTYQSATALAPYYSYLGGTPAWNGAANVPPPATFTLPGPPMSGQVASAGTGFAVPLCQTQYVRAMVHGYLEIPGDPSGRPASNVPIPGAPANSAGSYVLPAGRWVLPEDWPLLATFAGFELPGQPAGITPSPVLAWDINSGYAFNPAGENAVICSGTGTLPPPTLITTNTIPMADVDLGPCFGPNPPTKPSTTPYSTAGPTDKGICAALGGGETIGFDGFDPVQSCTTPFPLPLTPAGASLIGGTGFPFPCPAGAPAGPCLIPAGLNSNYLPNGTLNQWDAPMPAAQISFGITSGPGFLQTVNKTGLYALTLNQGTNYTCASGFTYSSSALACVGANGVTAVPTCATGYTFNPASATCQLSFNPNPFYAEAIPSSPFIPPVTNNGGYLWNSWNFNPGNVTSVSSTAPFSGVTAGGFVPGESTTAVAPAASLPGGVCTPPYSSVIAGTATCTIRGGTNITSFGAGCVPAGGAASTSVVVANGQGFMPGMTVEIYSATTGTTAVGGGSPITLTIRNVLPSPQAGFPQAVELQFTAADVTAALGAAGCLMPFSSVVISEQFGLPVPSAAAFSGACAAPGTQSITIGSLAGANATAPVVLCDTANNIVYVSSTAALARIFGPCTGGGAASSGVSRPGGPTGNPTCEPSGLIAAGTIIEAGPKAAGGLTTALSGPPTNPYPFWQFVGNNLNTANPTAGTVYSDNHGEAVVALQTGVATLVPPSSSGACPTGYTALVANNVTVNCQLPTSALSPAFANVATVLSKFSASNPGCIQTSATGTSFVVPGATIGATGPAAGQICVNALGGIEFGASAYLGQTTIQAVADYPYTRGEHPPIASAPLTKIWTSAFNKNVTVSAGSAGPANTTAYTVTITALDVCGNPIYGEPVLVYALGNAGAAVLAPVNVGAVLSSTGQSATILVNPTTGIATLSLEVLNSAVGTSGLVVKAVWPIEHIERFATVIPGTTPGATTSVVYAPGYQMVGGPAGSNFSVAEALFAYNGASNAYTNNTASSGSISSAAPSCAGYYAYFAAAMSLSLPASSKTGDTAACTLSSGWNLVGNPFATPAKLPSSVTAYHWNGTSYDSVSTIPVGGAVYVYNDGTLSSVALTAS